VQPLRTRAPLDPWEKAFLGPSMEHREGYAMVRFAPVVCFVAACLGLCTGGHAADWPQFHFSAERTGFAPSETTLDSTNVSQLGVSWRTTISQAPVSPPVVAGGKVFVGSNDSKVYALDASTGAILWSGSTGASIPFSPAVADGRVYVGSDDASVYAFPVECSTPCAPLWTRQTQGRISAAPAVSNGVVFVGAGQGASGELWALDGSSGNVLWRADQSSSPYGLAVAGDVLFVGGSGLFAYPTACSSPCAPLWAGANGGDSMPAVDGGVVYVDKGYVNNGFNAYPVSCTDPCSPLWIGLTDSGTRVTVPAIANGLIYRSDFFGSLSAYPAACATYCPPNWTLPMPFMVSSAAVANGVVYVGSSDGNLQALDAVTGQNLATVSVGDPVTSPAIANGAVYLSSYRGALSTDVGKVVALVLNPVDRTAPTLHVPADVTQVAPDQSGAVVSYTVTADDNVDPDPVVTCLPASGQLFPIGTTTVGCSASDDSGNSTNATFTVIVLEPWDFTITLSRKGGLDKKANVATVEGTVSCNRPGSIYSIYGQLEQRRGRPTFVGNFYTSLACDGEPRAWSATVYPGFGELTSGSASVTLSAYGCEQTCDFANVAGDVLLNPR
jgi:outer membrane protein assembly factor BamB